MTPTAQLTGSHLRTYQTIFAHPVSHNLGWRDVHALFRQVAEVEEKPNGNLTVTRNGQVLVLHPPLSKDVAATDELMALRHFLERSEPTAPARDGPEGSWLLVLNHHAISLYRSLEPGAVPQIIRPAAPEVSLQHTPHAKDFSRGQEKPDANSYYSLVAPALKGTAKILLFGSGTGGGSAMDQFVTWLDLHHPDLMKRIVGTHIIDQHHLSEAQLLAQAREFMASPVRARP